MKTVSFKVTLTPSAALAVKRFLDRVGYGDVYPHVEHAGDGNRLDSLSDRETRVTKDALRAINSALSVAAVFPPE